MNSFFDSIKPELTNFLTKIEQRTDLESIDLVIPVIKDMINPRNLYMSLDFNLCQFNIKHIGEHLIDYLKMEDIESGWQDILSTIIRFSKEIELLTDIGIESVNNLLGYYTKETYDNEQIYYALNVMPFRIINDKNTYNLNHYKDELSKHMDNILTDKLPNKKKEIKKLKEDCDNYAELLKNYKLDFSFCALNEAFNKLEKKKQNQLNFLILLLISMGVLIIIFPIVYFIYFYRKYPFILF